MERNRKIIKTSIWGIVVNALLVGFKMAVGLFVNSIAIILDALNNLSDALSSLITIIGTKLAAKKPDKKHPFGYGRIEYITSMIIAVIVLVAGLSAAKESIESIFNPEQTNYSIASLVIIAVGVVVKFVFGRYVKGVGKAVQSQALVASGADAVFDSILSLGTLVAALLSFIWGINVEGILGLIISVFIIKAGIEMLIETLNSVVGVRADKELTDAIKEAVMSFEQVKGVYDLTLHTYGPTQTIGTVHIEVDDSADARAIHILTRTIAAHIFEEFGIVMTIGIYASNTADPKAAAMKARVEEICAGFPEVLQVHGFYFDEEKALVMFDLIIDFEADAQAIQQQIHDALSAQYAQYQFMIILDTDFSE